MKLFQKRVQTTNGSVYCQLLIVCGGIPYVGLKQCQLPTILMKTLTVCFGCDKQRRGSILLPDEVPLQAEYHCKGFDGQQDKQTVNSTILTKHF